MSKKKHEGSMEAQEVAEPVVMTEPVEDGGELMELAPVAVEAPVARDEMEVLNEKIGQAQQLVIAASQELERVKQLLNRAVAASDQLIEQREALTKKRKGPSNQAIVDYIRGQAKLRADKAARMQELRDRGFDVGPVKSRLDQVMTRRTGHGHGRPSHPLIGAGTKE